MGAYLSLNRAIPEHMRTMEAAKLADRRRDQEFCKQLSGAFRDLVTHRIEPKEMAGLVLADFARLPPGNCSKEEIDGQIREERGER
jgi:hypothetical protein